MVTGSLQKHRGDKGIGKNHPEQQRVILQADLQSMSWVTWRAWTSHFSIFEMGTWFIPGLMSYVDEPVEST